MCLLHVSAVGLPQSGGANLFMRKIKLTHGVVALVDNEDYDYLNQFHWSYYVHLTDMRRGYARTTIANKTILMHHLILPFKKGFVRDHRDHNSLNNQRGNLRYLTYSENVFNQRINHRNQTGTPGVFQVKSSGNYTTWITINRKVIRLGTFHKLKDAVRARKNAEQKYYPNIKERVENISKVNWHKTSLKDYRPPRKKSKYPIGVRPDFNKWKATIKIKGKTIHLGMFYTAIAAGNAYRKAFAKKFNIKYIPL